MAASYLIASGVISGYASYKQAEATNASLEWKALASEQNAKLALYEGDLAKDAAFRAEANQRRQVSLMLGRQRAVMAASGLAVGVGTFGDILAETAIRGEVDAMAVRYEGEIAQYRKKLEARSLRQQARMLRSAKVDPFLAGVTGFATGGGGAGLAKL